MPPAAIPLIWSTATSWRAWCASTCPRHLRSGRSEQEKSPAGSVAHRGSGLRSLSLLIERHHLETGRLVVHGGVEQEPAVGAVLQDNPVQSRRERRVVRAHVRRVRRVAHHHVRAGDDGAGGADEQLETGHDRTVHRDREVERNRHRAGVRHRPAHIELRNGVPQVVVVAVPPPAVRGSDGAHGGEHLGHAGRSWGTGRTHQTLRAGGAGDARRTLRTNGAVSTSGALRTGSTGYALQTGCALRTCGTLGAVDTGRPLRTCGTGYALWAGGALRTRRARGTLRTRRARGARDTIMTHRSGGTRGTFHTYIALGAGRTLRTGRASRTSKTGRTLRTGRASR